MKNKALELKHWLEERNLSQVGFAKLLGVNDRTVRSWIGGRSPIPGYVTLTMEIMDAAQKNKTEALMLRRRERKRRKLAKQTIEPTVSDGG